MTRPKTLWCTPLALLWVGLHPGRAAATPIPADKLPEMALPPSPPGPEAGYLRDIHAAIHRRWTDNFLRLIGEKLEPANPLNTPDRSAEIDLVIGAEGQLLSTTVARPSGFPGFDDAIIEILKDAVPFPPPPLPVRSDDNNLHLRWLFARDQRRCAGITVTRAYDPIEAAMPKLLREGRLDEGLNRVAFARAKGQHVEPQFTLLANDWIKASLKMPWATVAMARPAAGRGDADAIAWLKTAIKRPELAAEAGATLSANKVAVCPLVKASLESANAAEQQTAALALGAAGEAACAPGLIKLMGNTKAKPEARAAAATALGPIDDDAAKKALGEVVKNDGENATVRAAAMLAWVRPGSGRVKVIAMERTLRDPSAELRAASAAGVVRAGGDANLADLYVLFKDNDPRASLASLRELEHLKTEESTKLILRLLHRSNPDIEKLAADILLRRNAHGDLSALKPYLDPATDPGVRGRALVVADETLLTSLAADPVLGIWVYRARLLRGEGDQAADWFLAYGSKLPPPAEAAAFAEWAAAMRMPAAPKASPTASTAPTPAGPVKP
jgi:HEAT repeat protein